MPFGDTKPMRPRAFSDEDEARNQGSLPTPQPPAPPEEEMPELNVESDVGPDDPPIDLLTEDLDGSGEDWRMIGGEEVPVGEGERPERAGAQVSMPQQGDLEAQLERRVQQARGEAEQQRLSREQQLFKMRNQRRALQQTQHQLRERRETLPSDLGLSRLENIRDMTEGVGGSRLMRLRLRQARGMQLTRPQREQLQQYEVAMNMLDQTQQVEQALETIPQQDQMLRQQMQQVKAGVLPTPEEAEAGVLAAFEQEQAEARREQDEERRSTLEDRLDLTGSKIEEMTEGFPDLDSAQQAQAQEALEAAQARAEKLGGIRATEDNPYPELSPEEIEQIESQTELGQLEQQKSRLEQALEDIIMGGDQQQEGQSEQPAGGEGQSAEYRRKFDILKREHPNATDAQIREALRAG